MPTGYSIIIVFRGRDSLPKEFSKNRLICFFDKYALFQPEIPKHPELYPHVMQIASYIAARFNTLSKLLPDPCGKCPTFQLPTEAEALTWLDELEKKTGTTIQEEPADEFPR